MITAQGLSLPPVSVIWFTPIDIEVRPTPGQPCIKKDPLKILTVISLKILELMTSVCDDKLTTLLFIRTKQLFLVDVYLFDNQEPCQLRLAKMFCRYVSLYLCFHLSIVPASSTVPYSLV